MAYQSKHTGNIIDTAIDQTQQLLNLIYPVGSIYMSTVGTDPATFIGGTLERIKQKFLLACDGNVAEYAVGVEGGAATHTHTSAAHTHTSAAHTHTTAGHTLTVNEIPSHTHTFSHARWFNKETGGGGTIYASSSVLDSSYNCNNNADMSGAGGGASHSHGNTGSTTPGNTGSTTPGDTGSSSNLPPYLAVYMWKRIA